MSCSKVDPSILTALGTTSGPTYTNTDTPCKECGKLIYWKRNPFYTDPDGATYYLTKCENGHKGKKYFEQSKDCLNIDVAKVIENKKRLSQGQPHQAGIPNK